MTDISEKVQNIPVEKIRVSKYALRPIDDKIVEELMQSIQAQGLLQPIMVRILADNSFELIFGNHRLEAYKRLRMESIPCLVREMDDPQAFMTAEVENLQKNNFIDPLAEAKGFQMAREKGWTEKDISKSIGKTQQYVSARLGLLRLEPEIQAQITSSLVTAEHGYELSKIKDNKIRIILAELSTKNREDCLNLKELREMAKLTIEELSKDARVDAILLRDPTERIRRIEMKLGNLTKMYTDLSQKVEDISSSFQAEGWTTNRKKAGSKSTSKKLRNFPEVTTITEQVKRFVRQAAILGLQLETLQEQIAELYPNLKTPIEQLLKECNCTVIKDSLSVDIVRSTEQGSK
jgi:ParB family chromosome partitioning protein